MNDYLTHLVARTFNPTAAIQPRLPGLFEPQPAAVELGPAGDLGRTPMSAPTVFREFESEISMPLSLEADPSQAFQGTQRPAALMVPPPSRIEEGAFHQTGPNASQPPTLDQPTLGSFRPARVVHQRFGSAALDSNTSQRLKAELLINQDSIRPSSSIEPEAPSKKRESFPNARAKLYPAPLTDQLISAPITVPHQATPAPAVEPTESATAEPAIQPTSPAPPSPIVVQPSVTLAQRVEPTEAPTLPPSLTPMVEHGRARDAHAEPAPPTIHITIGRVEVRAVLPPPSPARSAVKSAPAPHMSLDDYLRSRTGGGR